jgi:predicted phosphate transport protein (TIGR00153 family)
MSLKGLLSFISPGNSKFFDLFEEDTANLVAMAKKFSEIFNDISSEERNKLIREVSELEHKGDEITHQIFLELSRNFITPFDREDIHFFASSLDDVADFINGSASRINLYGATNFTRVNQQLADIILRQAEEIHSAVSSLKSMKNAERVRESIIRINALENAADDLFDNAIAQLFSEETNAIELLKTKEILSNMETATDKCEDVANVLETILVKNS